MSASIVQTGFGPGKGHAVITGDHDDCVVQLPAFFQQCDRFAHVLVEVFDLVAVIQNVVTDDGVVREDRRDDNVGGVFSFCLPQAMRMRALTVIQ